MAALANDRRAPRYQTPAGPRVAYKMAASTTIYGGGLVMLDATGVAKPAAKAANTTVVGVAEDRAVSGASGDTFVTVRNGVFRFGQLASDKAGLPEIGNKVYVEDDQTVRKTQDSNAAAAGVLINVEDGDAWVRVGLVTGD